MVLVGEVKAMPDPTTQKLTIAEYKEAQTKLSELMAKAVTGFAAAQQAGDLAAAKAWSERHSRYSCCPWRALRSISCSSLHRINSPASDKAKHL